MNLFIDDELICLDGWIFWNASRTLEWDTSYSFYKWLCLFYILDSFDCYSSLILKAFSIPKFWVVWFLMELLNSIPLFINSWFISWTPRLLGCWGGSWDFDFGGVWAGDFRLPRLCGGRFLSLCCGLEVIDFLVVGIAVGPLVEACSGIIEGRPAFK